MYIIIIKIKSILSQRPKSLFNNITNCLESWYHWVSGLMAPPAKQSLSLPISRALSNLVLEKAL